MKRLVSRSFAKLSTYYIRLTTGIRGIFAFLGVIQEGWPYPTSM